MINGQIGERLEELLQGVRSQFELFHSQCSSEMEQGYQQAYAMLKELRERLDVAETAVREKDLQIAGYKVRVKDLESQLMLDPAPAPFRGDPENYKVAPVGGSVLGSLQSPVENFCGTPEPGRRVFSVDTVGMPPADVDKYMSDAKTAYKMRAADKCCGGTKKHYEIKTNKGRTIGECCGAPSYESVQAETGDSVTYSPEQVVLVNLDQTLRRSLSSTPNTRRPWTSEGQWAVTTLISGDLTMREALVELDQTMRNSLSVPRDKDTADRVRQKIADVHMCIDALSRPRAQAMDVNRAFAEAAEPNDG